MSLTIKDVAQQFGLLSAIVFDALNKSSNQTIIRNLKKLEKELNYENNN
jgi:hypothetical protein